MKRDEPSEIDDQALALIDYRKPTGWVMRRTPNRDLGIDGELEVCASGETTGAIIKFQSKGTKSPELLKDGVTISFQAETKHAEYWCQQVDQPVALLLTDVTAEKTYWAFPQLDPSFNERLLEAQGAEQGTLVLHLASGNELVATSARFVDEYERCKRHLSVANIVASSPGDIASAIGTGSAAVARAEALAGRATSLLLLIRTESSDAGGHAESEESSYLIGLLESRDLRAAESECARLRAVAWNRLIPMDRSKVESVCGFIAMRRGDRRSAAEFYRKAHDHEPRAFKNRTRLALSKLLSNDLVGCHELTTQLRAKDPKAGLVVALWMTSAPAETRAEVLLREVPAELRDDVEVVGAVVRRAIDDDNLELATQYARVLAEKAPSDPQGHFDVGQLLLAQEFRAMGYVGGSRGVPANPARLAEATAAITKAIELCAVGFEDGLKADALLKRAAALGIGGDDERERRDIESAAALKADHPEALLKLALRRAQDGRFAEAIAIADRLIAQDPTKADWHLLHAQFLSDQGLPNAADAGAAELNAVLAHEPNNVSVALRPDLVGTLVDLLVSCGRADDAVGTLRDLPAGYLSEAERLMLQAHVERRAGRYEDARVTALASMNAIPGSASWAVSRPIAKELQALGLHAEALKVWRRSVALGVDGPDTRDVIRCAYAAGELSTVLEYGAALRNAGVAELACVEFEIAALRDVHEFGKAAALLDAHLALAPDDKLGALLRAGLELEAEPENPGRRTRSEFPMLSDLPPRHFVLFGRVVRNCVDPIMAVREACELVRENFARPEAHMALIAAFVPIFGPDPAIIEPTEVGPGAAVRYHEVQSGEKHAIVIRSTGVPKIELSEVSSDDPRVKALQGSRVGDTVRIPGTYADTQVRIDEVRADVVFRYQDSMHSFQERFPGVAFIQRFSAVDKDGNPNVAEIRRVFEEHARARATVLGRARGWYRSKGAPVGAVAQVLGATVVEAVAELVGPGDRVFCVPPGPGDYKRELSLFAACDAVLLDATALSTLILLDLQELFDAVPKQLVIARGTLSELEAISQQRGKPADIVAWIERIRAKCEVVGGGALLQLTSSERTSLVAVVGAACAEGVAIARDRKLPLWCDDFNTWRGVTTFASFRVWTQLVAQACQGAGTLATEKLTDVSVRVFAAGYRETVVDHLVIVRAAELAGWNPNVQPYASLLGWLRDVSAPTVGIGLVVGRALVRMADTAPLVSQEPEDAVEALVDAVGRRRDGGVLVETLSESLGKLLTAEHGGQAHVRRTLQATVSRMKK